MEKYTPTTWLQRQLFTLGQTLYLSIFYTLGRLEVIGKENMPKEGGVLLAANHLSYFDPPLVGSTALRRPYFFAKEELFRIPLFGWYIRQVNAFPVKRFENDIGAFKKALQLLKNGQAVVVFPEGTRSKNGELGESKSGAGMLAYKAKVPVVPVCIFNTNRIFKFRKVKIIFGEPIYPDFSNEDKGQYQRLSDQVMNSIAEIKRNIYNTYPNF